MSHLYLRAEVNSLPVRDGSVDTIITDPPWHFTQRVSEKAKAVAASNYELIEDWAMVLVFQRLKEALKEGGHLYVFVPERKLYDALALAKVCELEHFNTLTWVKVRKDGTDLRIGLGHTYRAASEFILCLSKGHRRGLEVHNCPSVLFAAPEGGSVKPAVLYAQLALASTPLGGVIVDPFAGSDPLGRAELVQYTTISSDIKEWHDGRGSSP